LRRDLRTIIAQVDAYLMRDQYAAREEGGRGMKRQDGHRGLVYLGVVLAVLGVTASLADAQQPTFAATAVAASASEPSN
jgi:hypothetical protein